MPWDLTHERREKFTSVGFEFDLNANKVKKTWDEHFADLVRYKEHHGHCNVPCHRRQGFPLAEWLAVQRNNHRTKPGFTETDRYKKLTELGVKWKLPNSKKPSFEERLAEVRDFRRIHGHCNVTTMRICDQRRRRKRMKEVGVDENSEEYKQWSFEIWALRVRREYGRFQQGMQSYMDKKKIKKLDELGFVWENPEIEGEEEKRLPKVTPSRPTAVRRRNWSSEDFDEMFGKLHKLYDQFGDCNDPRIINKYFAQFDDRNCTVWRRDLLNWMTYMRDLFDSGKIPLEHQTLLESINFDFLLRIKKFPPFKYKLRNSKGGINTNSTENPGGWHDENQMQNPEGVSTEAVSFPDRRGLLPTAATRNDDGRGQPSLGPSRDIPVRNVVGGTIPPMSTLAALQHQHHHHQHHPYQPLLRQLMQNSNVHDPAGVAVAAPGGNFEEYESLGSDDDEYNYR